MAARKKQGTLSRIGQTVTDAAKTAVNAAEEYVVEPVSNLLGVGGKKSGKPAVKKTRGTALKKKSTRRAASTGSRAAKRPSSSNRSAVAKRPSKAKRAATVKRAATAKRPAKAKRK
jgi:hypothetical protein